MVKAASEARINFGSDDSMIFKKIDNYRDGLGLEVHKKFSIRRFLFPLYVYTALTVNSYLV